MRKVLGLFLVVGAAAGCVEAFGNKDPHDPGESLGTFHITATQTKNSCGEGALGAPAVWEFDVGLAAEEDSIFWDSGGQVIVGTFDADTKTFQIEADVVMDMRDPDDGVNPPCSMARHDVAKGTFKKEGETMVSATGSLSYTFAPTAGSDCGDLVTSETPTLAAIPCAMAYSFKAPRTGD